LEIDGNGWARPGHFFVPAILKRGLARLAVTFEARAQRASKGL
jgi:hypothetical protein